MTFQIIIARMMLKEESSLKTVVNYDIGGVVGVELFCMFCLHSDRCFRLLTLDEFILIYYSELRENKLRV